MFQRNAEEDDGGRTGKLIIKRGSTTKPTLGGSMAGGRRLKNSCRERPWERKNRGKMVSRGSKTTRPNLAGTLRGESGEGISAGGNTRQGS